MQGHYYRPECRCPDKKKCNCGAKWAYIVDIGIDPKTGERKQKKKGGYKTKKEAVYDCSIIIKEIEDKTFIQESSITFETFSEEWLVGYENTGEVKVSTVRVRKHEKGRLLPYLAQIKLKDITRKRYQDALYDLKARGLAETTIEGCHVTGRMIFKKAIELGLIKNDPTQYATVPKTAKTIEELEEEEEVVKYLEKEELSLFLKNAKGRGLDKDYPAFLILSYTGMRVGELCALKWKDINFDKSTISITKTLYNPDGKISDYVLLPPKTKSSKRIIEIDADILANLENYRKQHNAYRMKHRNNYHDEDFIFINRNKYKGYPVPIKLIEKHMLRILKLAKLNEKLTPHSLRHTHTSLLAEAGVSLPEIMERLGHKSDKTTTQVYLHATQTMKKEASQKFSKLMKSLL